MREPQESDAYPLLDPMEVIESPEHRRATAAIAGFRTLFQRIAVIPYGMPKRAEAAEVAGWTNEHTFSRHFVAATGMGYRQFIKAYRIRLAQLLLGEHDWPVERVAHRLGYKDASSLRRLLRFETGRSPSSLRPK
jgi:AraC-like DNA-binding protein